MCLTAHSESKATRSDRSYFGQLNKNIRVRLRLSRFLFPHGSARQSLDAATFRSMYNAASPPPPSSRTQTQLHANMIIAPNHRKSQSLDAGNVLSASNSNSNLNANSNVITEAAIKASATTKSVYCTRERCVIHRFSFELKYIN